MDQFVINQKLSLTQFRCNVPSSVIPCLLHTVYVLDFNLSPPLKALWAQGKNTNSGIKLVCLSVFQKILSKCARHCITCYCCCQLVFKIPRKTEYLLWNWQMLLFSHQTHFNSDFSSFCLYIIHKIHPLHVKFIKNIHSLCFQGAAQNIFRARITKKGNNATDAISPAIVVWTII